MNELREWLNIHEATIRLSEKLSETVTPLDICRLVLEGHLRLSLYLPSPVPSRKVTLVRRTMKSLMHCTENYVEANRWVYLGPSFLPFQEIDYANPVGIDMPLVRGIQYLALIGEECLEVERLYAQCANLPLPIRTADRVRGIILDMGDDGLCQLQTKLNVTTEAASMWQLVERLGMSPDALREHIERFESLKDVKSWSPHAYLRFIPMSTFPADAYPVVRKVDLEELIQRNRVKKESGKPSSKRTNTAIAYSKNLTRIHYGEDAVNNIRRFADAKDSPLRQDFEDHGLRCPVGLTLQSWFEQVDDD